MNKATRAIVSTIGVIFGFGGMNHGFFETLQGNKPTGSLMIEAIGESQRFWSQGNEPALTIVPNFLVTGVLAMLVGMAIIVWSIGFLHKKDGALVFLMLFIALLLVGGGVGQVLFFVPAWLAATRIHKPLTFWRRVLSERTSRALGRTWKVALVFFIVLILFTLQVATFGIVPGVSDPDQISMVMVVTLGISWVLMWYLFIAGFAQDIAKPGILT
mgnify:CR=1 FL=1